MKRLVVHYAPYGKNALGQFDCGASDGGYTGGPALVTCEACKDASPGIWPPRVAGIERQPVVSSSVSAVGYDESTHTLEVEYSGGSVYQYYGVPAEIPKMARVAQSAGSFLAREVKGRYAYRQIHASQTQPAA